MKILVVLSRVPWPLEKGDKLRAYHMIREWSKQHEVNLFCLSDQHIDPAAEKKLKEHCNEVVIHRLHKGNIGMRLMQNFFTPLPFQTAYFYSKKAQRAFDALLDRVVPDHIFCQLVRTAPYVSKYSLIPKSIDYMDAFSAGMERMANKATWPVSWLMNMEARRLRTYENQVQQNFGHSFIISEQDRKALEYVRNLEVIPNGIDPAFLVNKPTRPIQYDVLFTGNMSYRPNVESAKFLVNKVMPLIWQKYPNACVCLAGANPSNAVKSLSSDKVEVTGWVDDISEVYRSSRVFCAPMLVNSGLQNKLLEAMAIGLPSVTTTLANNALGAKPEEEILIGDNADSIAQHLHQLLNDQDSANILAKQGQAFVLNKYSWESAAEKVLQIIHPKH